MDSGGNDGRPCCKSHGPMNEATATNPGQGFRDQDGECSLSSSGAYLGPGWSGTLHNSGLACSWRRHTTISLAHFFFSLTGSVDKPIFSKISEHRFPRSPLFRGLHRLWNRSKTWKEEKEKKKVGQNCGYQKSLKLGDGHRWISKWFSCIISPLFVQLGLRCL